MIARRALIASLVVGLALGATGCAASAPQSTFASTAAEELQSTVLSLTEAAGAGDFAAAAGRLDELEASTIAAYSRGEMSDARFDAIMVAISLVRDDLQAAIAAAQEAAQPVAPVESEAPTGDSGSGSTGPVEPAPAPVETDKGNGRGNPGVPGPPDDTGKPKD